KLLAFAQPNSGLPAFARLKAVDWRGGPVMTTGIEGRAYCFAAGVDRLAGGGAVAWVGALGVFAGGCVLLVRAPGIIRGSASGCVGSGHMNSMPSTTITAAAIAAQLHPGMPWRAAGRWSGRWSGPRVSAMELPPVCVPPDG